ncbi:Rossmann-fold NAD(P)-binding domain-containing protein [Flammeovirga aprica]|uniref:Epimerase n=1 Tax=Flammeovirga aprica JL-4 TaxID=694437 RepID=A0A7X9RTM7_9BACT|nr:epimerase [Flammeovirga aprica]NME68700.1 epimerase [Flammeovirga aprica JL-4]
MKVIITGSTGMVGKGTLLECLESSRVDEVLVVNRTSINMTHPKLKEILLNDLHQIATVKDQLIGYDACFYCMGISALGLSEETYTHITYDITKAFVDTLYDVNPNMVFNYVSGIRTDSSEKGNTMWARVKGKTENAVLNKGFKDAYAVRLGTILPEKGIQSKTKWYNTFYMLTKPLYPLFKRSSNITTTTRFGQAMISSVLHPREKKYLYNKDLNELANA